MSTGATYLSFAVTLIAVLLTGAIGYFVNLHMHWLQTKRDVYMDLAVSLSKAARSLAAFGDPSIPIHDATARFVETADAPAKAHVIAGPHLSRAIMEASRELLVAQAHVMAVRVRMDERQAAVLAAEGVAERIRPLIDAVLAEKTRYNVDGLKDPHRWEALERNYQFQTAQFDKWSAEAAEARAAVLKLTFEAGHRVLLRLEGWIKLSTEVLAAIREELGQGFDEREHIAMQREGSAAVREYFEAIREQVSAQEKD